MPRKARYAPGGLVYHVLNRAVAKLPLFRKEADYAAFERIMIEAQERHPTRLLAWCLMKNHWHFVVWPRRDDELTVFMRWLAHTHAMRWHVSHNTVGGGHLYQGRFKSFPVQSDRHLLQVCRYVERNALTAGVVERAEEWRWASLWARREGPPELRGLLSDWPGGRPDRWVEMVNRPMSKKDLESLRMCVQRGRPFGDDRWQKAMVARLDLIHTIRSEGRPRKNPTPEN